VGAGEQAHGQEQVRGRARHRPAHRQRAIDARQIGRAGDQPDRGDSVRGRLEPEHAAEVGRHADGAAEVGADVERREAGGQRGGGASARSTRRARAVVRVERTAEQVAVRLDVHRHVGLAEQDAARAAQPFGDRTVAAGHVMSERLEAGGGAHAGRRMHVLERERHAVQIPPRQAALERDIGGARPLQRALGVEGDDGVERLEPVDASEVGLDDLARRGATLADHPGQLGRREGSQILGRHAPAILSRSAPIAAARLRSEARSGAFGGRPDPARVLVQSCHTSARARATRPTPPVRSNQ
jgi:hypothetical protein